MSTSHPAAPPAPQDPGLQAERTRLAWQRTALALGVCAVLVLRSGLQTGAALSLLHAALLGLATILLVVMGLVRERQLARGGRHKPQTAPGQSLVALASGCAVLAALGTGWLLLDEFLLD